MMLSMVAMVGAAYLVYRRLPASQKCPAYRERWRRKKRAKARRLLRRSDVPRHDPRRREARLTIKMVRRTPPPLRPSDGWSCQVRDVKASVEVSESISTLTGKESP